jgi:hypothetical protein
MLNQLKWIARIVKDVAKAGVVNRSYALSFGVLALLAVALAIVAAEVSAPLIYTLF